jgi:hypothetical protein
LGGMRRVGTVWAVFVFSTAFGSFELGWGGRLEERGAYGSQRPVQDADKDFEGRGDSGEGVFDREEAGGGG